MEEESVEYNDGVVQPWHRNASRIRAAPGVTVIPESAFSRCTNLRVVDLSNVTILSIQSFVGCLSLERVVWTTASAVEISEWAFAACHSLQEIDLSNATKIGKAAFLRCDALTSVTVPSSVDAIERCAFYFCISLAEVKLCEGIQRIGSFAFCRCVSLARISIPASVAKVEGGAFQLCTNLVEVVLCEGLQRIGGGAFEYCTSLLRISIPSSVLKIGEYAFDRCNQLRSAELQEGLQMIKKGAFSECRSLERITIPSSATLIGCDAFQYCTSLSEVTLREGAHCIEDGVFDGCTALQHINIPPIALVIDIRGGSCQLMRATMALPAPWERKLVVSKWLQYRSPSQLALAEAKVNEILARPQQTEGQKITLIRERFAYYDRLDVTTMLELAIWRVNIVGNEQDANTRQARRRSFGSDMNIIIPRVLEYLEG